MMPKTKLFTSILVGIILFIRLFDLYYTPLYNPDKLEQLIAAKNWAEGHGVSRASYVMKDTLTLEFAPLVQWPPGYSLVTGLLMNSRISIHTIVTLVDGLTLLLFALFSIVFIQSLHFEWKHSAWILWIVIMLNTSLSWQLTSVDFISITLFWEPSPSFYLPIIKREDSQVSWPDYFGAYASGSDMPIFRRYLH